MSNEELKNKPESKAHPPKKKKKYPLSEGWIFPVEGTVAEPWTSAKELLEDKELQEKIKKVRELVKIKTDSI